MRLALNLWSWDCWHVSSGSLNLVFLPHFSVMPGLSQCLVHDSNYSTAEQHLQSLDLILIFSYYSWESPKKPNMHVLYLIFIPIILFWPYKNLWVWSLFFFFVSEVQGSHEPRSVTRLGYQTNTLGCSDFTPKAMVSVVITQLPNMEQMHPGRNKSIISFFPTLPLLSQCSASGQQWLDIHPAWLPVGRQHE